MNIQDKGLEILKVAWKEDFSKRKTIVEIVAFIVIAGTAGLIQPGLIQKYPTIIGGLFVAAGLMTLRLFIGNLWKTVIAFYNRREIEMVFDRASFRVVD